MKKVLVIILTAMSFTAAKSQQVAQQSQYMINPYLLNPGAAGDEDFAEFFLGVRAQNVGIDGAPMSRYFSVQSPIEKHHGRANTGDQIDGNHHGVGLIVKSDHIGEFKNTGAAATYAYNIGLGGGYRLALGVNIGFKRVNLNTANLTTQSQALGLGMDPATTGQIMSNSTYDFGWGLWFHSQEFFVGASATQFPNSVIGFTSISSVSNTNNFYVNHYHFMGGYRISPIEDLTIIPSLKVSMVKGLPLWIDFNTKARYKDMGWLGVSYRHQDAVSVLVGVALKHHIDLGMAFDFPTTELRKNPTFEVMLGYRIDFSSVNRSPNHYW